MINIEDVISGESYAARFRVVTMLNSQGLPNTDLKIGQAGGTPGEYEGLGVLIQRDVEAQAVRLKDVATGVEFVVPWRDLWDIDTVEWQE